MNPINFAITSQFKTVEKPPSRQVNPPVVQFGNDDRDRDATRDGMIVNALEFIDKFERQLAEVQEIKVEFEKELDQLTNIPEGNSDLDGLDKIRQNILKLKLGLQGASIKIEELEESIESSKKLLAGSEKYVKMATLVDQEDETDSEVEAVMFQLEGNVTAGLIQELGRFPSEQEIRRKALKLAKLFLGRPLPATEEHVNEQVSGMDVNSEKIEVGLKKLLDEES